MELQWQLIKARAKDIFRQKAYLLKSVFSLWPPALKPFGWHIDVQHRGKIFRQLRLAVISQRVLLSELPRLDMKGPDSEAELRALRAVR